MQKGSTNENEKNSLSPRTTVQKIVKFTRSPISQICECMGQPHDTDNSAPPFRTMQQLFWTLSYRLHCLAAAHGITLTVDPSIELHVWHALSTPFGNAHINENGDALLVVDEWDKIIKQLYQSKDMSLESLVEKFQIALHNHYIEGGTPLYNVTEMRDFTEKHAPGLFKLILCSIAQEGNSITKNRQSLQDQRVVALLHIIAYFRPQKTSAFQKDLGLYLNHHGTSRAALNSGPLLGFSAAPRTIDRHNKQLLENYPNQMNQVIEDAEKCQSPQNHKQIPQLYPLLNYFPIYLQISNVTLAAELSFSICCLASAVFSFSAKIEGTYCKALVPQMYQAKGLNLETLRQWDFEEPRLSHCIVSNLHPLIL
ncbi:hypothetical protein QZH41_014775 [Actinostola sp. cb2023]|nr:hypothetical protein QZH41_014775 [Actinostola sp. cb2023]